MARRRQPPSNWPPPPPRPRRCGLCLREVPRLTEHHLVPRSQGRRRGRKIQQLPTAMLCPACHKFLHKTFSNAELEQQFSTLAALQADERVRRFVAWLSKQPPSKSVRVR